MPTRNEIFQNHKFNALWDKVITIIDEVEPPIETNSDDIQNMARLKKAVAYIGGLINAIDKELVPQALWDSSLNPTTILFNQLNSYSNTPAPNSINNANTQADSLIQFLSPYALATIDSTDAMNQALNAYTEAIKKHTKKVEKEMIATLKKGQTTDSKLEELLTQTDIIEEKINDYKRTLFEDNGEEVSTKSKIDSLSSEITAARDKILDYRTALIGENGKADGTISDEIKTNASMIAQLTSDAATKLKDMNVKLDELNQTYDTVMGSKTADGETTIGLQEAFETQKGNLEEYDTAQKRIHEALKKEINNLLPGATSAGLASSFSNQKDLYKSPIRAFEKMFYVAVGLLFIVGFTTLIAFAKSDGFSWAIPQDVESMLVSMFARTPFVLPLIWLAYFAAKRRNEYRRLEEEYAHKETISRSYYSFKQQVKELDDDESNALSAKLLEAAIEAVALNASQTLDKDHDDKLPSLVQARKIKKLYNEVKSG